MNGTYLGFNDPRGLLVLSVVLLSVLRRDVSHERSSSSILFGVDTVEQDSEVSIDIGC